MPRLPRALDAWNTPDFAGALKRELEALGATALPLDRFMVASSAVLDAPLTVLVLDSAERDGRIRARVGVFFSGIVAGCSCADDPTPVEAQTEYRELLLGIDMATGETTFAAAD